MQTLIYTSIDSAAALLQHQALLPSLFALHQSLRPHFTDFDAYVAHMQRVLDDHARLLLVQHADHQLVGLALYRMHHNTYQHKLFFLEDLVVAENVRGQHIGGQILQQCEHIAQSNGCRHLSLDSATFRTRAHKFYYLHGYVADCFHFSKTLPEV